MLRVEHVFVMLVMNMIDKLLLDVLHAEVERIRLDEIRRFVRIVIEMSIIHILHKHSVMNVVIRVPLMV